MSQSLGPHALDRHRAFIGLEVTAILDGYWQSYPHEAILDAIRKDWMDTLQDWHVDQVKAALTEWRNKNPSKKPNPGHILKILKHRRGTVYARRSADRDPLFALDRPHTDAVEVANHRAIEAAS